MAEKRKSDRSVCVKIGAKTRFKIEFFAAEQWTELARQPLGEERALRLATAAMQLAGERFRLRINRRWHDGPGGEMLFLDMVQAIALIGMLASGENPSLPPIPDLPRGTSVKVPCRTLAGETLYEITRTGTEPILAHDGRWYVDVYLFDKGSRFVPVDELIVKKLKRRG